MIETKIFEELIKIEKINIELKADKNKIKIFITGKSSISKNTMEEILNCVNKFDANLKLLPYGVFEITVKEDK